MDNIFILLDHYCLVYVNDILIFSKTIEQHKDDIQAITQRWIDHSIILRKNKYIYAE